MTDRQILRQKKAKINWFFFFFFVHWSNGRTLILRIYKKKHSSVKLRKPAHSAAITKPSSAQGWTIMRLRESRAASNAFLRSKNSNSKKLIMRFRNHRYKNQNMKCSLGGIRSLKTNHNLFDLAAMKYV